MSKLGFKAECKEWDNYPEVRGCQSSCWGVPDHTHRPRRQLCSARVKSKHLISGIPGIKSVFLPPSWRQHKAGQGVGQSPGSGAQTPQCPLQPASSDKGLLSLSENGDKCLSPLRNGGGGKNSEQFGKTMRRICLLKKFHDAPSDHQ